MTSSGTVATARNWIAELRDASCAAAEYGHDGQLFVKFETERRDWVFSTESSFWLLTSVGGVPVAWRGGRALESKSLVGRSVVDISLSAELAVTIALEGGFTLQVLPPQDDDPSGYWSIVGNGRALFAWGRDRLSETDESAAVPVPDDLQRLEARELLQRASEQASWKEWLEGRSPAPVLRRALNQSAAWLSEPEASADQLTDAYLAVARASSDAELAPNDEFFWTGSAFHHRIDESVVPSLLGVPSLPVSRVPLAEGWPDVLVADLSGGPSYVVEVKGTDWDAVREKNIEVNVRRHLHQLTSVLHQANERYLPELNERPFKSAILYPARPLRKGLAARIERRAEEAGVSVIWYEDAGRMADAR